MNGRRLLTLTTVAVLALAAGFVVSRITDADSTPSNASDPGSTTGPRDTPSIGGVATASPQPASDDTFTLTAHVTGPLPQAGDPCYADTVTFSVEDASSGLSHPILAYPDTVEPATCEEVLVTFTLPRADAYAISFQDANQSGSWGPYSFSFLERSDWSVYLQTF